MAGRGEVQDEGYLLGIDNGGTLAKAALFSLDGRRVGSAQRKAEMDSPQPGWTERDMETLWQSTAAAVCEVIRRTQVDPRRILGVACTGHGNGLYLVDERGAPVRPGIVSTDGRAAEIVRKWQSEGVAQRVLPKTMQSLWPGQPNALLCWLGRHEPQVLARARWALMCKDFIRLRLTGEVFGERTDMSGTSLLNVREAAYDEALLGEFGLADCRRLLPPLRRSEELCGQVTPAAAEQTGLIAGTPVAGGLFDIDACALASGLLDERRLSVVAGTWSINQYVSKVPVIDPSAFMTSLYCVPEYYLIPEASATSASNLEWFVTRILAGELGESSATSSTDEATAVRKSARAAAFARCDRLVAETPPQSTEILFLPFLYGSNLAADAGACLLGVRGWHSLGHVLRAIYEGVVFGHKTHVDRLLRFRSPPQSIRLTGGAARSDVWVQAFADVFQLPVEIPAGEELGALGAAMCAGVASGCFRDYDEAVALMVHIERTVEPHPGLADWYAARYHRYLTAAEAVGILGP